jgi:phosphonopyruvate decarboxylase
MGSMAVIGANKPDNIVHIVINNGAHETVGGMPTVAGEIDMVAVAKACGYPNAVSVSDYAQLDSELEKARDAKQLSFIEVKCAIGSRPDLGRPTLTAKENKENFVEYIRDMREEKCFL